jgi:hypothetical protein
LIAGSVEEIAIYPDASVLLSNGDYHSVHGIRGEAH